MEEKEEGWGEEGRRGDGGGKGGERERKKGRCW